jgi:hypothetical protein
MQKVTMFRVPGEITFRHPKQGSQIHKYGQPLLLLRS